MKPEDIDRLFSERLGNNSPTPPANLWNRLQERIEEEIPTAAPQIEEKNEGKQRFMWVYQVAAAVVALLLTFTILFNNLKQEPVPAGTIAKHESTAPTQEQAPAIVEVPANKATAEDNISDKAILEKEPVKEAVTEGIKTERLAKVEPKADRKSSVAKNWKTMPQHGAATGYAIAAVTKYKQPSSKAVAPEPAVPATLPETPVALASANTISDKGAQPVEITFKFANTRAETSLQQEEEVSGLKKKGRLAKNIFKQVRNLSNGERVELSELGINADKIALETQIGKQKISKVIHL